MELEDAIKHCEEVAKENDDSAKEFYRVSKLETRPDREYAECVYVECKKCADEHRQLAEWLKELKERREKDVPDINVGDMVSRQKAIDAINNIMPTKEGLYEPSEVLCKLMQLPSVQPELEHTMEEFMYGQDLGSSEDGSL